jgi:parallel beta-helix repeat protein
MAMRTLVSAAVTAVILQVCGGQALASTPRTWVVDDDGAQCANADFARSDVTPAPIQAAVAAAQAGDLIRVCPGRYTESVTVDKPLTLKGDPDALEALDCFDPTPSQLGDLDPTQQAIVDGDGLPAQELFNLEANDIVLEGFVLQGASSDPLPADFRLWRRAINASDGYSGYRIDHNLIRLNTVAIQFGSAGGSESRFDHNCLRHNGWGLATDERDLVDARVDHNATFQTRNNAFEPVAGRVENVTFDHNLSRQDNTSYLIRNSAASRIVANTIESARVGIVAGGGPPNIGLEITGNLITNPLGGTVLQGIAFAAPPDDLTPPNSGALVAGNTITGMRLDGIAAAGPPNAPRPAVFDSVFADNVTSDNLRDGIVLRGGNAGNTVRGNIAERNGRNGIYAQGAIGNLFEANSMSGNGTGSFVPPGVDARDGDDPNRTMLLNTWVGNQCLTDFPAGTICGMG